MIIDKDYFDVWMRRLMERLERLEQLSQPDKALLPDGNRLMDNTDLCAMLNVSKRTLQRYRVSGELRFERIYHKTFYRESDVAQFIEKHFSKFKK